jgi:predicted ATPase
LSRLKGVLLLRLPSPEFPKAEACFQQALGVARRQQARALELRAAPRAALAGSRAARRRPLLVEIYRWFTEGFDTADLQEAKTLLEELEG